ncbi:MAG: alpha/beta hydrolase [Rhodospirillaceae bacterium]|jgi:acetyl esterase|nr:alpha/beta hydrolase [Rhodospirillaceae bacterium]
MTLEPEMHAFIARTESFYAANAVELSVAEQREMYRRLCQEFTPDRPMGVLSHDAEIEGPGGPIPVRHYYADASKGAEKAGQDKGPPACVLYLHGGGFVVGDLDSHDFICAHFAAETGANVIAVDYRLAPEHKFPAAFEDALAAYRAVRGQPERWGIDAERIVVAGDSAGANLTAAVVLASRDDTGPRAVGQILFYGRFGWGFDLPSFQTEADAPLLTTSDVRYYRKVYCGPDAEPDPRHSPLTATGLSRLPPALLLPVEHDPLRDESFAYGEALRADGVDAEVHLGVGLVHGSLRALHTSPGVRKMVDLAVSAIKTWAR